MPILKRIPRDSTVGSFSPMNVTGAVVWLDGADATKFITTGGHVTSWLDKSGNNNNAYSGTGYPTYSAPYLNFDGTGQQLVLPLVVNTDWSIFVVAKTTQTFGSPGGQWWSGTGLFDTEVTGEKRDFGLSLVGGYVVGGIGGYHIGPVVVQVDTTVQSPALINDGRPFIAEFLRVSSTGQMTTLVTGGSSNTITGPTGVRADATRVTIGSEQTNTGYFTGSIGEIIAYNTVISVEDRIKIESYLAQKWECIDGLPAGHPGLANQATKWKMLYTGPTHHLGFLNIIPKL
jgi:hypothetical protein